MKIFYLLISLFFLSKAYSQVVPAENTVGVKDSSVSKKSKVDTAKQKIYDPKVAARRSAIIPGWGQI